MEDEADDNEDKVDNVHDVAGQGQAEARLVGENSTKLSFLYLYLFLILMHLSVSDFVISL